MSEVTALAPTNGAALAPRSLAEGLESVLIEGDLSKLRPEERATYYLRVCESMGLNPMTKPLQYIRLDGALTLYATRSCTDQLRSLRGITIDPPTVAFEAGLVVVTVTGRTPDGRQDTEMGAVPLPDAGVPRANACMKAFTKAKRRLTLSLAGLGWVDESEVGSISSARQVRVDTETGEILDEAPAATPANGHSNAAVLRSLMGAAKNVRGTEDYRTWCTAVKVAMDEGSIRKGGEAHATLVKRSAKIAAELAAEVATADQITAWKAGVSHATASIGKRPITGDDLAATLAEMEARVTRASDEIDAQFDDDADASPSDREG